MKLDLDKELYKHFQLSSFREGQKEVIEHVMKRENVLAVMPTGTGKSLCYQLPARLLPSPVIVISPLLSLMFDQVKKLKASGFKRVVAINSMMEYHVRKEVLYQLHHYQLIYVSPEILQSQEVLQAIQNIQPSLMVIDEAHCISQWGHEFRPDYLRIKEAHDYIGNPPILALTATATPDVQHDIIHHLDMKQPKKVIFPIDKSNLSFVVEELAYVEDKLDRLISLIHQYPVPTMIYFSSRKTAEQVAAKLQHSIDAEVGYYHGGLSTEDRVLIQEQFMRNELQVICCTSAFGMGIDKPDIRQIIHYHLPTQVESFIQEVGRGGRDGLPALSITLYHPSDIHVPSNLVLNELPSTTAMERLLQHLWEMTDPSLEDILEYIDVDQDIKESHLRFIVYHLEKYGVLNDYQIIGLRESSKEELQRYFQQIINSRTEYKLQKLREMMDWIECSKCRREALFQSFQKHVEKPSINCCNNCGFEWDKWKPNEVKREKANLSWEKRLRLLLLQDKDEWENIHE